MRIFLPRTFDTLRALVASGLFCWASALLPAAMGDPTVPVAVVYDHVNSLDEDDMCYWVHPTNRALSTVIVTDKFAGKIFVYGLNGTPLQELSSPSPRNVDTRYNVPFDHTCIDVVAMTDRTEDIIRVYKVDRATRMLTRIDDGQIFTEDNYGFTLYQGSDGQLLGLTGDRDTGLMRQFALFENGLGQMSGYETSWTFQETRVEGVVADDETGYYYLAEESVGIWRVGVFDHTDKTLIATVGDATGLQGDLEGLAIYYAANGEGYIIVSSQGDNKFTVIDRKPPHQGRGNFRVAGVRATDGLDVLNMNLNPTYSTGIFTAHNGGSNCCSVAGVKWADIANALGLLQDTTYWDPRIPCERLDNVVMVEQSRSGGSVGSATVATDSSIDAAAGDLYVATVATRGGSASVQSVTGLGLSWTFRVKQCSGRGLSSLETWTAQGTPSGAGIVTANLSNAPLAAAIALQRYSHVRHDPLRNIVSSNTRGPHGACSGGTDGTTYALDVQTTTPGSFVFGAATMRHHTHVPAERYRERIERHAGTTGNVASVATVDRLVTAPGTIPLLGSFSSATDWAVIGFEILPEKRTIRRLDQGPIHLSGATIAPPAGPGLALELSGASPNAAGLLVVSLARAGDALAAQGAPARLARLPLFFDDQGRTALTTALPPSVPECDVVIQAFALAATLERSNVFHCRELDGARGALGAELAPR